jgi:DNA-binding transcriptional LysR family regulator
MRFMAMLDDLRVFARVGALRSFAAAARALGEPRSNVSRSIARLEASLGLRLVQRTTREVTLTPAGESLMQRCAHALGVIEDALTYVNGLSSEPQGLLRVSAGIGFGINVLSEQLPAFLRQYPLVDIDLDLTSRVADLVGDRVDVAIRFGELPDSSMVAVRLGEMKRVLCASPEYLERHPPPTSIEDLAGHDTMEMPTSDRQPRRWSFYKDGKTRDVVVQPRVCVNDALTIHRLTLSGAGIGVISCYLCAPDIDAGRLIHILPDWTAPPVLVNLIFPSRRELTPSVRAFVDYLKASNPPGMHWQNNMIPSPTV